MQSEKFTADSLKSVQDYCNHLVGKYGTQSAAAATLGISDAHFISFRRGDWEKISESSFNLVAARAGVSDWKLVDTRNLSNIAGTLDAAQTRKKMVAIIGDPGAGKTEACRLYTSKTPGAYYMMADAEMTKARFLTTLMREMGMPVPNNLVPGQILEDICTRILSQETPPLIVIDDASKLKVEVLRLLQIIYDRTKDRAGIAIVGVPHLKKMIDSKCQYDVMGFRELRRRFAYWITLESIAASDIVKVCKGNDIDNADAIKYLTNEVTDFATLNFLITEAIEYAKGNPADVTRELLVAMRKGRS